MTARVRSVRAWRAASRSRAAVSRRTSTGTGTAPAAQTAAAVGTAVNAGTITSSPGTDAERDEAEPQRVGARRDRDGVSTAAERRELGFEGLGLGAEQELTGAQDALDGVREVRFEARDASSDVDDRKRRGCHPGAQRYHSPCRR